MRSGSKILCFVFCIVVATVLSSCNGEAKKENAQLKQKVKQLEAKIIQLQAEKDTLAAVISKLQQTDDYYYKMAVDSRQSEHYEESNRYLEEMIEKFPQSSLTKDVETLVRKNNNDIAQDLYDRAIMFQRSGKYVESNSVVDQLLTRFPTSSSARKAKQIRSSNQAKVEEAEEAKLKREYDLELLDWNWSESYGYVEARGQIKNISGESLRNVQAIVSFYDGNGGFITSSSALTQFNPILPGQTSPFSVPETHNPAMKKANIQFSYLMGGKIPTYHKKK